MVEFSLTATARLEYCWTINKNVVNIRAGMVMVMGGYKSGFVCPIVFLLTIPFLWCGSPFNYYHYYFLKKFYKMENGNPKEKKSGCSGYGGRWVSVRCIYHILCLRTLKKGQWWLTDGQGHIWAPHHCM